MFKKCAINKFVILIHGGLIMKDADYLSLKNFILMLTLGFLLLPLILLANENDVNIKQKIVEKILKDFQNPNERNIILNSLKENKLTQLNQINVFKNEKNSIGVFYYLPKSNNLLTENNHLIYIAEKPSASIYPRKSDEKIYGKNKYPKYFPAYVFDLNKNEIIGTTSLNIFTPPMHPAVIISQNDEKLLMHEKVGKINKLLEEKGLHANLLDKPKVSPNDHLVERTLDVSAISGISFKDVQEYWFEGDPEVYAIISGVMRNRDNQIEPVIRLIELPYITKEDHYYKPNQIIVYWDDGLLYSVVDVHFYENDSTDYKDLITLLLSAAGTAADYIGDTEISAISKISQKIIEAMPDDWFRNDDDYLDSFYTLEKAKNYNQNGAAENLNINITAAKIHYNELENDD